MNSPARIAEEWGQRRREYQRKYAKEHPLSPERKERIRAYNKEYYSRPDVKAHRSEYSKEYHKTHPRKEEARSRAYYLLNKENILERTRKYGKENREKCNAWRRAWVKKNKGIIKERTTFRKYGLTKEGFDKILDNQGGVCAICKKDSWGKRGPHVDHDHSTGVVRGVLCNKCNSAIGLLGDTANSVYNAACYLRA